MRLSQYNEVDEQQNEVRRQTIAIQQRNKKGLYGISSFILVVIIILLYNSFNQSNLIHDAKLFKYLNQYNLHQFWIKNQNQLQQQLKSNSIIPQGHPHHITRQQLGKNSWTLLHMITGSFPDNLDQLLTQKFNTFLILFAQMYPCKLCANHFIKLLQEVGPFTGNTKQELMIYLCKIHNQVNVRLGKNQYNCKTVVDDWNTCGCTAMADTL